MSDEEKSTDQLLLEILEGLRRSRAELCWCEMGIGNPMVREHSTQCLKAQASYGRLKDKVCTTF